MSLFQRKRYAFSERLRQREKRRQRIRLLSMFVICLALLGFLRATSDSQAGQVAGPSASVTTEDMGSDSSDQVALKLKTDFDTAKPSQDSRIQNEALKSSALASDTFKSSISKSEILTAPASESSSISQTVRASLQRLGDLSFGSKVRSEPTATGKPVLSVKKSPLQVNIAEVERALVTLTELPSSVTLDSGVEVELSIDAGLQAAAEKILSDNKVPYGAIVAIEPATGKILALAGHSAASPENNNFLFALRSGMPAASLIKVISAAAAIEKGGSNPSDKIRYRGGMYTLNKWNYKPDSKRDTLVMSLEKALATSCNPVFGRLGLQVTGSDLLTSYAGFFGFNAHIPFVLPLQPSRFAEIVDDYSLARTAAGFGDVTISPLHAALLMGAIANDGTMMKPMLVRNYATNEGGMRLAAKPEAFSQVVTADTANTLLEMMETTITAGTGRRQFSPSRAPTLRGVRISAKTGTLTGPNPQGRYHWLIAAAPVENPTIAIAALVVDPGNARINGTGIGRLFLEKYFAAQKLLIGKKA